jgi:diadenosine tetraphosphatase ApaH/serine/threonine PP2A family protein phosphatase
MMLNTVATAVGCGAKGLPLEFTPTPENLALLEQALPFYPFQGGLAVHAGLFPALMRQYPRLPELSQRAHWPPKLRQRLIRLTFCRFVNPQGQTVVLGQEQPGDYFWAEGYGGDWGRVFFGHQPFLSGVRHFPHAIGLDTGCVFGGQLTAACLSPEGALSFVSVPAEQAWAEPLSDGMTGAIGFS